jgi:RNA polymerase sigma factor (sigma-70 family)
VVSPSLSLLRTQSDERLTALARAGHERAFEAIVERHRRPLLRHARRLLPEARAEEAVQQALLAAWAALARGDEVRHVGAWLHRIVHNAALNAVRGERDDYAELREWLQGAGAPEDELERRELLRETLASLASLPPRQREALLRVAVDGDSAEEAGSRLGLSEGAVRQLLYRARTALRAAATAVTPLPAASWVASVGTRAEPLGARIAELVAGAGSAGLGATLAKTGMAVVVAGSAAAGPVLVDDRPARESAAPRVEAAPPPRAATALDGFGTRRSIPYDSSGPGPGGSRDASGSSGSGPGASDERSGSSGSGSSGSGSSGSGSGSRGSGSDTSGSGSGSSGPGPGTSEAETSGSGSSGPGPGTIEADTSGSGSTGSGSSGSGG